MVTQHDCRCTGPSPTPACGTQPTHFLSVTPPFFSSGASALLLSCKHRVRGDGNSPAKGLTGGTQTHEKGQVQMPPGPSQSTKDPENRNRLKSTKILCCCQAQSTFSCFLYLLLLYAPWSQPVHLL